MIFVSRLSTPSICTARTRPGIHEASMRYMPLKLVRELARVLPQTKSRSEKHETDLGRSNRLAAPIVQVVLAQRGVIKTDEERAVM